MNDAEVFWQAVAASVAAATALSTGLAWAIGSWARNRSRAEADWVYDVYAHIVDEHSNQPHFPRGHISVRGKLANAGDASAFRLTMKVTSGSCGMTTPTSSPLGHSQAHGWVAVLPPGESVDFWAIVPPQDWGSCVISLDWIASPTRLKKHLQLAFKPADECPDPKPVAIWTENGMSTSRPQGE